MPKSFKGQRPHRQPPRRVVISGLLLRPLGRWMTRSRSSSSRSPRVFDVAAQPEGNSLGLAGGEGLGLRVEKGPERRVDRGRELGTARGQGLDESLATTTLFSGAAGGFDPKRLPSHDMRRSTQSRSIALSSNPRRGTVRAVVKRAVTTLQLQWTGQPEADRLISEDPTATPDRLLPSISRCRSSGRSRDRLRMRERLGTIDPVEVARMDPARVEQGVPDPARAASLPGEHGARRLRPLHGSLPTEYVRDTTRIWTEAQDAKELLRRFARTARLRCGQGTDHGRGRRQAPGSPGRWERIVPIGRHSPTSGRSRNASTTGAEALPSKLASKPSRSERRTAESPASRRRPPSRERVAALRSPSRTVVPHRQDRPNGPRTATRVRGPRRGGRGAALVTCHPGGTAARGNRCRGRRAGHRDALGTPITDDLRPVRAGDGRSGSCGRRAVRVKIPEGPDRRPARRRRRSPDRQRPDRPHSTRLPHTRSISLRVGTVRGDHRGDTLFGGGPGKRPAPRRRSGNDPWRESPPSFCHYRKNIVLPGHGTTTTIAASPQGGRPYNRTRKPRVSR